MSRNRNIYIIGAVVLVVLLAWWLLGANEEVEATEGSTTEAPAAD